MGTFLQPFNLPLSDGGARRCVRLGAPFFSSLPLPRARNRQPRHRLYDQREAFGQVVARPAIEPHPLAILAGDDSEAIVLDLMKPERSRRRAWAVIGRHGAMKPAGRVRNNNMPGN
jgi:hypothetical protein